MIQPQNSNLQPQAVRVYRSAECRSDHFMLKAKALVKYKRNRRLSIVDNKNEVMETVKYNIESLRHDSVKCLYKIRLANKLRDNKNINPSTAENCYNMIKESIHSTAREALGEQIIDRRKNPEWWTKVIERKVKEKKQLYQKWLNSGDNEDRKCYAEVIEK